VGVSLLLATSDCPNTVKYIQDEVITGSTEQEKDRKRHHLCLAL